MNSIYQHPIEPLECPFPGLERYWAWHVNGNGASNYFPWANPSVIQFDGETLSSAKTNAQNIQVMQALNLIRNAPDQYIYDAFAGSGAFSISAARMGWHVCAVEISSNKVAMARHNAMACDAGDKIQTHCASSAEFLAANQDLVLNLEAMYLDPPWGEAGYGAEGRKRTRRKSGRFTVKDLPATSRQQIYRLAEIAVLSRIPVALSLPKNYDYSDLRPDNVVDNMGPDGQVSFKTLVFKNSNNRKSWGLLEEFGQPINGAAATRPVPAPHSRSWGIEVPIMPVVPPAPSGV